MSSGEGVSKNHTSAENTPIQMCHELLEQRDFAGVRLMVDKLQDQFEQARAISDVLLAADNPFPNGLMDYYGMLRVTRPGPVLKEDFMKLMKLLDGKENTFPLRQEAADNALQAWSMMSNPHIKAQFDLMIPTSHNSETQGNDRGCNSVGGGQGDDEVETISDDDNGDDTEETITMARTAKLCKINGKRVKVIPLKKRQKKRIMFKPRDS